MNRAPSVIALALLASLFAACSRTELSGPPPLRAGRDLCAECGMIINEERCSSGLLVEREGERRHLVFDDLGCLLSTLETAEDIKVLQRYARDYQGGGWVEFEKATFLFSDREKLPTPMGSGIVAFASRGSAEAKRGEVGGEMYDATGIQPAHAAWMEAHFGKRSGR